MTRRSKRLSAALAGTALALLIAAPAGAAPFAIPQIGPERSTGGLPLLLAQGGEQDDIDGQNERRKRRAQQEEAQQEAEPQAEEAPRKRQQAQEQQEAAPEAEQGAPQAEESPREKRRRERQQAQEQQEAAPEPEQATPPPEQAEESPRERRRRERQQAQEQQEAAPEPEQATPPPEQAEESPRERRRRERQQAQEQQQRQNAPEAEQAAPEADQAGESEGDRRRRDRQQAREQQERKQQQEAAPQPDEAAPQPEQAEESERDRRQRERTERTQATRDGGEATELPPGEAPSGEAEQRDTKRDGEPRRPRQEQAESGPPPSDDRAAQDEIRQERMESVDAEEGSRRREVRGDDDEPRERPSGTDVVREMGDRLILRFGDQVRVESSDRPRLRRNARDVFVEDLPRQRTRETVVRADGTRLVTIRNRYGDVIRRSRIEPEGREYVLNYVEEEDTDRVRDWRDPGLDLPPFRLDVPREDYILDAARAPTDEDYYEFLERPPVERVERLYSVDEVKRSARVRQKTRRVDLDTITFDFGSASVPESQINKLDGVASAMDRLLQKNPAETFLIEGHTDAVGSDEANLALSDRRAEAVAEALTNVFDIPPENLATQGYGEQYLKVQTSAAQRENRRVAIRRITPLVAPVASAN